MEAEGAGKAGPGAIWLGALMLADLSDAFEQPLLSSRLIPSRLAAIREQMTVAVFCPWL
jgi:hypothetical protein